MPEKYPWHICDEEIGPTEHPFLAAEASAAMTLTLLDRKYHSLPTVLACTVDQPGITEPEALQGSKQRELLKARLQQTQAALRKWNKSLWVDRLHLKLADGNDSLTIGAADFHYAAVAHDIVQDIGKITGQAGLPHCLICQDAGTRYQGSSEIALAEAKLDIMHPALNFIVVTPLYWCRLEAHSVAMLDERDALEVSLLESIALAEIHAGRKWFCPLLQDARREGRQIVARFSAMTDLVLDEGPHGFEIDGITNDAQIEDVQVKGKQVILTLTEECSGSLTLRYAHGQQSDGKINRPANQGSLRDTFQIDGINRKLHRFALSAQVKIL